ncbi:hypothetical protein BpHYR1_054622 [Brachionus plicatilis]|uniref:Uncharacterized protein n=1 Tax=Brachionus plicatilis TaxID=10195 RepID=A0A3M7QYG4_BRAPC|nr:hypothetical protein BpHYR1_054622 [Brachionus plicatilis]
MVSPNGSSMSTGLASLDGDGVVTYMAFSINAVYSVPVMTKNTVHWATKAMKSMKTIIALPTAPAPFLEKSILQKPGTIHKQFIRRTARTTSQLGNTRKTSKLSPNERKKITIIMSNIDGPLRFLNKL